MTHKHEADVAREISTWIAKRTGRCHTTISVASEFASFGLDSIAMIELVAALESVLGARLPEDTSQVCRTIGELAALGSQLALGKPSQQQCAERSQARVVDTSKLVLPRFTAK